MMAFFKKKCFRDFRSKLSIFSWRLREKIDFSIFENSPAYINQGSTKSHHYIFNGSQKILLAEPWVHISIRLEGDRILRSNLPCIVLEYFQILLESLNILDSPPSLTLTSFDVIGMLFPVTSIEFNVLS